MHPCRIQVSNSLYIHIKKSHHAYSLKCTYLNCEQYMQTIQDINKQLNE